MNIGISNVSGRKAFSKRKIFRNQHGSSIAEFAPAIFLLILVVFFPMIDFLGLAFSYGCVWYLNHLQVREAAVTMRVKNASVRNQSEVNQSIAGVAGQWSSSGLGRFTRAHGISQQASLVSGQSNGSIPDAVVTTTASVDPFLTVPFFFPVTGLNKAVTFSISGTRPVEDAADAGA